MSQELFGNVKGLKPSQRRSLEKLYRRRLIPQELVSLDLAREVFRLGLELSRKIALLISREGDVIAVAVGSREIVYLPDLGRYRFGKGRLRRLRLIFSDLSSPEKPAHIPADIYGDLQKLRLDAVVAIKERRNKVELSFAHMVTPNENESDGVRTTAVDDLGRLDLDFERLMEDLETELQTYGDMNATPGKTRSIAIGVYSKDTVAAESSMRELSELARTAGVEIVDRIIQRKTPDPKTVIGKGRLEDAVLRALRLDANLLIFDCELSPGQWRVITNSTELKVIDRSMLILDIFAQRAKSSEGRLQVELAQLKYTLPRLQEMDTGLSRLTGGIGGRGPGETKMEIGRRRIKDRISLLEKRIDQISEQRSLRRRKRQEFGLPLVAIVGYTNVGKSTLFNALSGGDVLAEDKLFATLDTTQRKVYLASENPEIGPMQIVMSDTVGFIRELPKELFNAFRATLEELYDATLILHVMDASDPEFDEKRQAVEKTLSEMKIGEIPMLRVFNKIDSAVTGVDGQAGELKAIKVSALKRSGFSELRGRIFEMVSQALQSKYLEARTEISEI